MFIPAPQHAHVDSKGAYCKPTCWLHRNDGVRDGRRYTGRKRVIQRTVDGEIVRVFDSAIDAAELFGCPPQSIGGACRNGSKSHGYYWSYEEGLKRDATDSQDNN